MSLPYISLFLSVLLHGILAASTFISQAPAALFGSESDREALLELKATLGQQSSMPSSWNRSGNLCRWPGVTCSRRHKDRVSALDLSSTGLLGTIPPSIGNLTFLTSLYLSQNSLHGEIPGAIGQLRRLRYLDISNNSLQGEISSGLRNCSNLASIRLGTNQIIGEIPAWLGDLPKLQDISLRKNNLTGVIPWSLANLSSSLMEIDLTYNLLDGTIPQGLGSINGLKSFRVSANRISGTIPSDFSNASSLMELALAENEMHGTLPFDMGNGLPVLRYLLLGSNRFTGRIPSSLANATMLYWLDLDTNRHTGTVPPEIGKLCPDSLIFDGNMLEASSAQDWEFITILTNCSRLRWISINYNMLGGELPSSVANLSSQLQLLDLSVNEISGKIPFGIGNLAGLQALCLGDNKFTGVLPHSIGMLSVLKLLKFESNKLSGNLPSSIGNLTELEILAAYNNSFEGPLPASLGKLHQLTAAGLSYNKFTGPLPREIFNMSSLSDALYLSHNYFVGPLPPEVGSLKNLAHLYIYGNNLSGTLPDTLGNCLSMIKLRLDDNFKAIVLEYVNNGSLDRWIHQDPDEYSSNPVEGITLMQRLKIAVDVCDALDYLHNSCHPPIVHCDLKPSNILLNEEFRALVSDFGIAKILSDSANPVVINSRSSTGTGIRGTIGYVAPEYGEGSRVSPCGDAYSFGTFLLEMFTGKAPTDDMFKDGLTLQSYVQAAFPDRLMQVVDPTLVAFEDHAPDFGEGGRGNGPQGQIASVMASVTGLALLCSKQTPTERISMGDAVAELRRISDRCIRNYLPN